jgi:hypothetical protein
MLSRFRCGAETGRCGPVSGALLGEMPEALAEIEHLQILPHQESIPQSRHEFIFKMDGNIGRSSGKHLK